ncbi:MAG TPA: ABC transporter permease [Puia sp.]|nr:ABC transporter permease [Puia sp.]
MNSMLMLKTQLRVSVRHIRKNKAYSLINVLGLALGISICLVIYLIVHFEFTFDSFHPGGQYIYRIINQRTSGEDFIKDASLPPIMPLAARQAIPGLEAVAGYIRFESHIGRPGIANASPTTRSTIITDANYFSVFPYHWLAGSPATALDAPFRVVLTASNARSLFGKMPLQNIMNQPLTVNDSLEVFVSGIVEDWSGNTDFPFTAFISLSTVDHSFLRNSVALDQWGDLQFPWNSHALLKLTPGARPDEVAAQLSALARQKLTLAPGTKLAFFLQPLADVHFDRSIGNDTTKTHRPTLYVLMGIAGFILLLAVVNFINLSTAMSLQRAKEIGIRKVLGSLRAALILQFLLETAVLTLSAVGIALLLVTPILWLFQPMLPGGMEMHWLSPDLWIFLFTLTMATILLAGLYPARMISSWLPVVCLKGSGNPRAGEKAFLRKALIIFQFTISLVFIISTLIIEHQISYMRNEELGFSTDAVLTIQTDLRDTTYRSSLLAAKIRQVPGVRLVARQSFDPITDFHVTMPVQYRGKKTIDVSAAMQIADSNFIPLFGIKLLAGSNIRNRDSLKEVVINETMSRDLGFATPRDAVGQPLWIGESPVTILGVVADFHEYSYHEAIRPIIISHIAQPETMLAVKLDSKGRHIADLKNILAAMESRYKSVYPALPWNYRFLDDAIANMYKKEEQTAFLMRAAVLVTIFISCIGLFGLAMFTSRQRTKEMGIRKVLGATGAHIVSLLSRSFLALIAIAALIASPIAWLCMHYWLQNFVYRAAIPVWAFLFAALGALAVAFLTILFQTLKAAFINPVEALRTE